MVQNKAEQEDCGPKEHYKNYLVNVTQLPLVLAQPYLDIPNAMLLENLFSHLLICLDSSATG